MSDLLDMLRIDRQNAADRLEAADKAFDMARDADQATFAAAADAYFKARDAYDAARKEYFWAKG